MEHNIRVLLRNYIIVDSKFANNNLQRWGAGKQFKSIVQSIMKGKFKQCGQQFLQYGENELSPLTL
jgi:hypothetical protein